MAGVGCGRSLPLPAFLRLGQPGRIDPSIGQTPEKSDETANVGARYGFRAWDFAPVHPEVFAPVVRASFTKVVQWGTEPDCDPGLVSHRRTMTPRSSRHFSERL